MDIKTKLAYAEQHVKSISRHEDEDAGLRIAALARITELCGSERAEIEKRLADRVADLSSTQV